MSVALDGKRTETFRPARSMAAAPHLTRPIVYSVSDGADVLPRWLTRLFHRLFG